MKVEKLKKKKTKVKSCVKVPVIMQLEALECGAACLCMVLAYYGKWVPLEQVRADCGVSRDGSKASNILKAARNYGLTAQGYRFEPEHLRENGKFPCIIHWNFNHFVVLNGFKGNRVYINDPAKGAYSVSMDQFDKSFTGVCLSFGPGEQFVPDGKPKSTLSFIKKRMTGTGPVVAFVVLTTAIISLLGIVNQGFSRVFLDRLLTGQNPEWIYPFLFGLALMTGLMLIVAWIQAVYTLKINGKLAIVANSSFIWHVNISKPLVCCENEQQLDLSVENDIEIVEIL